jgi:hypothetical protein
MVNVINREIRGGINTVWTRCAKSPVPTGHKYLTNKKYVHDQDVLRVNKFGDTMYRNSITEYGN